MQSKKTWMHLFLILEWFDKAVNTLKYPQTAIIPWCSYAALSITVSACIIQHKCRIASLYIHRNVYSHTHTRIHRYTQLINMHFSDTQSSLTQNGIPICRVKNYTCQLTVECIPLKHSWSVSSICWWTSHLYRKFH